MSFQSGLPSYIDMPNTTTTQAPSAPRQSEFVQGTNPPSPPYYPSLSQPPPYRPPMFYQPSAPQSNPTQSNPTSSQSNPQFQRQVKEYFCELHDRIDNLDEDLTSTKNCLACSWCCFLSACTGLLCGM